MAAPSTSKSPSTVLSSCSFKSRTATSHRSCTGGAALEASDALQKISAEYGVILTFEKAQLSLETWALPELPDGIWHSDRSKNPDGFPLAGLTAMHEYLDVHVGVNIGYSFYNMPAGSVTVENFPWMLRSFTVVSLRQLSFMKS